MLRLLSLMTFLLGLSFAAASHAETLKVCYDQWPPMTIFPSKGAPERGVVIDMVDEIFSSKGYQLEYLEVPFARGLDMVADGSCDLLPEYPASQIAGENFVSANQATFSYSTAFVVRKGDTWRYDGLPSIQGKYIATGLGWDYRSMSLDYHNFLENPKHAPFVEVVAGYDDVVDRIMIMIKENRVDLYADNELVLQFVLNRLGLHDDLEIVRPGLENKLIAKPIFSKRISPEKRRKLMGVWDAGRLSMKGEKEQLLLKKYDIQLKD